MKTKINMHGDHEASCLCCKFAYYDEGSPGYSEMTPGSPAELYCIKGVWSFSSLNKFSLDTMHDAAKTCKHFSARESKS